MTPNLLHYSLHSQKIKSTDLEMNKTPPPFKAWKLLTAISIDFYIVAMCASFMTFVFQAAIAPLMPTGSMRNALVMIDMNMLSLSILPLITLGYFFFCFFMNEGQTYGMYKMKLRIEGTKHDYKNALLWSARSASVIFTGGMTAFMLKNYFSTNCVAHDHLYQTLMLQKEWKAPSLVDRTIRDDVVVEAVGIEYAWAA